MFSGIVDHIGIIKETNKSAGGLRLLIGTQFENLELGESIAVDGCCLTVEAVNSNAFRVSLSQETLDKSFAGNYGQGTLVNLERALRLNDRIGGHMVTGHVDQTAIVSERNEMSEYLRLAFAGIQPAHRAYLVKKGSITVNGVSLTVNDVSKDGFEVMLIPHTLERTNLSKLRKNDRVNLEFDWMSKVIIAEVRRQMENR